MEKEIKTKVVKNQTAKVGDKYSYKYVDIAQIHDYLESINARYIQQIQRIENDDYVMTKRCFDNKWENEWLQGCKVVDATLIGVKNPAQEQGSALTYARRYSLLMAFGLATEDDDAQSLSQTKEITQEDADNYTLKFGKYKGKLLKEVFKEDPEYVDWMITNSKDERLLDIIRLATGLVIPTIEEQKTKTELLAKIMQSVIDIDKIKDNYDVDDLRQLTIEQMKEIIGGE